LAYKYCENDKPMLRFVKGSDGSFFVFSPFETRNYFLLNKKKINSVKLMLKKKDTLSLFSVSQSIIKFEIEIG